MANSENIEHGAQQLTGVPTGHDLRYHLDKFADMATVESQQNVASRALCHPAL